MLLMKKEMVGSTNWMEEKVGEEKDKEDSSNGIQTRNGMRKDPDMEQIMVGHHPKDKEKVVKRGKGRTERQRVNQRTMHAMHVVNGGTYGETAQIRIPTIYTLNGG